MSQIKLIEIISQFSLKEKEDFWLYASGPYWRLNPAELFYLKSILYPNPETRSREDSGQGPAPSHLLHHKLLKVVNAYLVHLEIALQPLAFQEHLAMAQIQRGCEKNYQASIRKFEKMLEEGKVKDHKYHGYEMTLWRLKEASLRDQHRNKDGLMKLDGALDAFFIENKLLIMLEMASRKKIISESDFNSRIAIPWSRIENQLESQPLGIRFFYHLYQMLTSSEKQLHFVAADRLFLENHHLLEINYKQTVISYLMNYCIQQLNQGLYSMGKKYLDYVDFQDKENTLLEKQMIHQGKFQNIVNISLKIGEFDWCLQFVRKYEKMLPQKNKEAHSAMARANLYFYQQRYSLARKTLIRFKRKEYIHHIISERLHMKILFELQEFEKLNSTADNFMRYVRTNKKLPDTYKKRLHSFARVLNRLAKYKGVNPEKVRELRARVEAMPHIPDKDWLLEKMT